MGSGEAVLGLEVHSPARRCGHYQTSGQEAMVAETGQQMEVSLTDTCPEELSDEEQLPWWECYSPGKEVGGAPTVHTPRV